MMKKRNRLFAKKTNNHTHKDNKEKKKSEKSLILAPFNENLPPKRRTEISIELSDLITKIATHIICYTLVYHQDLLKEERMSIAHAFLQRATTTHLCNHKLTAEGLVYEYKGQSFTLHEEYKTMTLTRSVYEHLSMFYFLFEHPHSEEERDIVWKYWQLNSKKNLLGENAENDEQLAEEQQKVLEEIKQLRSDILSSELGGQCKQKLAEWTRPGNHPNIGSIEFVENEGKMDVRKLTYSQAWKYLFDNEEMTLFYRHLSIHCHPVYGGLLQYQNQALADQGHDGIPLYFSSSFLAYLCRLFLKLIPNGNEMIAEEFSKEERTLFQTI